MYYTLLRYTILKYHREMALEETIKQPYENIKYAMYPLPHNPRHIIIVTAF